jgi:hypothetical protein
MKYLIFIVMLVVVLITAGCVSNNIKNTEVIPTKNTAVATTQITVISSDPIVGSFEYYTGALTCTVHFGSEYSFSSDCSLFGDPSGRWTKTDINQYKVTFTNGGSYTYTYYPNLDQISVPTTTPPTFMYRPGKRPLKTSTPTPTVTYQSASKAYSGSSSSGGSGGCPSGECWVNGYYRSSGVYVNGYCRRC